MSTSSICLEKAHRRRRGRRLFALFVAACIVPRAQALDPHRAIQQYIRDHWGDEQGYPGGAVNTFAQTPDGYLWIGAENGLVRFDGLSFQLFNYANTPEFPASPVLGLLTDREGTLWIRLENRQILRYRGGVFQSMPDLADVTAMSSGVDRDILLIRSNNPMRYKNQKLYSLPNVGAYTGRLGISIAETRDGTVWVGTRDRGLYALRAGHAFAPLRLRDRKVNCLLAGDGDDMLVGTDHGLLRWNGHELTQIGGSAFLRHVQVLTMARDHDANIWVGTAQGLIRTTSRGDLLEDGGAVEVSDPVSALFEDREGNLWIGQSQEVKRYRDSLFLSDRPPTRGSSEDGGPIYVDRTGRTWFGPSSGGLFCLKSGVRKQVRESGLDRDVIYSIDGGPGELWVGRQRGGLTRLLIGSNSLAAETFTASQGLAAGPVYAVHRNRNGTVWAGTLGGGVSCLRDGHLKTYTAAEGLASNTISAIEDGVDGTIWVATSRGLNSFAHDRWRTYTNDDGVPPGRINSLSLDSVGVLWIGTESGLAFLRKGRIQLAPNSVDWLPDEVLGVVDDDRGWLWIATSKHVLRVSRAHVLGEVPGTGVVREFGPADGVPSPEGVRRFRSVLKDADGRVWFSLRRSISVIDAPRAGVDSVPAIVHIQSVSADGRPLGPGTQFRVPASRQRIRFEYLALSLSVPDRVRYRYRLNPFDGSWSRPSAAREAVYTNLRPGSYTFHVIASNSEGIWNSTEAMITIEVVPAFWQTVWFRVLLAAVCACAMLAVYRRRLHRLTEHLNLRFEERLAERTRIAQELHDTLLQGIVSASMQLHVAIERLPADSSARPHFKRTMEMMRQVVTESRNAVQELRSNSPNAEDLENAFSKVRTEYGEAEPALRIVVDGRSRPLNPLIRDEIYRIGREALSNAFRHSGAATVEMEIQYNDNDLRVSVRDSGRGIDEEVIKFGRQGHWGLIGMRERAEKIGASLRVWSRRSAGTELQLTVPGHIAFPKAVPANSHWLPSWIRKTMNAKRTAREEEKP